MMINHQNHTGHRETLARKAVRCFRRPVLIGVLSLIVVACVVYVALLIRTGDKRDIPVTHKWFVLSPDGRLITQQAYVHHYIQPLQEVRQQAGSTTGIYEIVDGDATPLMKEDFAIYIASTTW